LNRAWQASLAIACSQLKEEVQNSTDPSVLTASAVSARADELLSEYRAGIADIAPEAGFGGIWESEMFLFYAAVRPLAPKQVLESGRARGKSTLILARCFPEAHIISVELNSQVPNAAAAEAKLAAYSNVELLYGDSREIMARRLQNGDAVLIDGPKGFRALKLALQLLSSGKPCTVFIHDCPPGSPVRDFLVRHWPGVFFGDDLLFRRFQVLDEGRDPLEPSRKRGYGIFACLPARPRVLFWWLRIRLLLAEVRCMGESQRTISPGADA
jgi:predicted O-methyltransferase YrrM